MRSLDVLGDVAARGQISFFLRKAPKYLDLSRESYNTKDTSGSKDITLPHISLLIISKLTFDLGEDVVEWLGKRPPSYLPIAIQHLITRSGNILLHYYLYGGLSTYAPDCQTDGERLILVDRPCLDWMEEAMRSEGETIDSELTKVQIKCLIEGGHI
jgi:hypothetical protein